MDAIRQFFTEYWTYMVGWTFAILTLVWRYKQWDEKRKEKAAGEEKRLVSIETRLHLLDCPEEGRVNKMSKLCESQIESNKRAYGLAMYVKGKQDAST